MADLKITELAAAGALTGTELIETVQGGVNVQTTTQDIADLGAGGGGWPLTGNASLTGNVHIDGTFSVELGNNTALSNFGVAAGAVTTASATDNTIYAQDDINLDATDDLLLNGVAGTTGQVIGNVNGHAQWEAAASGGHVIEDEGTPLTQRSNLNFVGAGVTATDAGGKTVVTISGAGVSFASAAEINTGTETAKAIAPDQLEGSKYITQSLSKIYAVASGTNTYTASLTPALGAYSTGQVVFIQFTNAQTSTTPTLNINSLGAKTIVKRNSTALISGDIAAGQIFALIYDGTNFRLLTTANNPTFGNVLVDDEVYGSGWNGSLQVPTKNAVYDKIQTISPVDYSRQALTVAGGPLTTAMDFNSLTYRNFDITSTQSANFSITFSNSTNLVESRLTMRLTGAVVITLPAAVVMQTYETINGRWNTSTKNLTLTGTTATPFMLTFYSDGTNVIVSASDPCE